MILLDYKDRRPIYEQVMEKLQDLMVRGILEQDSQLPSVRSLATDLSINPNTIQRAYAELERRGYIYSVKGRGSFVADHSAVSELGKQELRRQAVELASRAFEIGLNKTELVNEIESVYEKGGKRSD